MFENERERNRNDWVREKYDQAERIYRRTIASVHNIQDIIDQMHWDIKGIQHLTDSERFQNRYSTKKHVLHIEGVPCSAFPRIKMAVYNMSLHQAIHRVAGPIHRRYNVDWQMDVSQGGDVDLISKVGKVKLVITVNNGIPKCKVESQGKQYHYYVSESFKIVCS